MYARTYRSILLIIACLILPLSVAEADTASGLVSHWMLDDGAGTVAADSVGDNHGTLQGDAAWAEGYTGGAILLDGLGDYVDCGNKDSLNITDTVTLAAWVQADGAFAYPDWSGIMMRGGPNIDTFALYYNGTSEQMGFKTTGTTPPWFATGANTTTAMFDGDWHHVAATYDGAMKRVYLDGAEVGNVAATGKIETSNGRLMLGAGRDLNPPTHFVAGRIDDARLYSRALTAKDVKELMPPKLQAYGPNPADGAVGVQTPLFSWKAGDTAVLHEIYLGKNPELDANDIVGPRQALAMYWHLPGLEAGVTYYWRVDEVEADGVTIHTGNVWTFITQALTAYRPDPADGATDVPLTPVLTWLPGQTAIKHHLYFSNSFADVNDAAAGADKGELAEATFSPGTLEPVTAYYWRVDETIAGGTVRPGPVWTFATCLPVDDFESYTDDEGSRIYETWIDGYTNGLSGSTVGYIEAPFTEQTIVHGGSQSMPLDYNNINSPFYSEAEREFATAQDWTFNGVDTLVLYVRGQARNAPATLYLALEDSAGKSASVAYPDAAVVAAGKWTRWQIGLSEFTGVNPARIKKLIMGLGDKANPAAAGTGLIFVDDIKVIKSAATP